MAWSFTNSADRLDNASSNVRGTVGSIACWVKPNWSSGDGAFHWFYELGDTINERYPYFRHGIDNSAKAGFLSLGEVNVSDAGLFTSGTWASWILTWDTTVEVELFHDGVSLGSDLSPNVPATQAGVTIGNTQPSHAAINSNSTIMEWAMWDRVLSATEIANLALKYWAQGAAPSGLVAYYPMDTNASPVPDSGSGNFDLTVTGAVFDAADPGIIYSSPPPTGSPWTHYARMMRG